MCKCTITSTNPVLHKTLLFLFIIPICHAVLVNRTIDSNKGDPSTGFVPIYQPQPSWADQTCSGCYIQPDITKAYDGTWEAATYNPGLQNVNITLQFTGVAIKVFFILANANSHGSGTTTNTQVNITLDGQYAGNFSHYPDMSTEDLIYNATVFAKSGLANASHEVVIATNDYPNNTFINFDWALYTADVDASASHSALSSTTPTSSANLSSTSGTSSPIPTPQTSLPKTGIIVGCAVGALTVFALVTVFLVRRCRRPPLVRHERVEGALNIDVPPRQPKDRNFLPRWRYPSAPSASGSHSPYGNAGILQEARQREINRRIKTTQREMDKLESARNATSPGDSSSPASPGQPGRERELASLRNELQQLRDQIGHLQARQETSLVPSLSDELVPPSYTRH